MLEDVGYMHGKRICHGDVDPGNFLRNDQGRVLLTDLAMSFDFPPDDIIGHMGFYGKPHYWAPGCCFVPDRETGQPVINPETGNYLGLAFYPTKRDLRRCSIC